MAVRVFLLDDHDVVRAGLAALIDGTPDLEVVGQASTVGATLDAVRECKPDVAVFDARLGDGSGIDACRAVRAEMGDIKCLVLTAFEDDQALVDAAEAGAAAFVLKEVRGDAVLDAIGKVAAGHQLIDRDRLNAARARMRESGEQKIADLTPKERQIFELIGDGLSNREIADRMYLAEKTVKNYVSKLLMKLGKVRRTEAAALAARLAERDARR